MSAEVTSTHAPRVKAARRLVKRALRAADRRFLAEGPQAAREALAAEGVVHEVFVTADAATRNPELFTRPRISNVRTFDLARGTYDGPPMKIQPTSGVR